MATDRLTTPVSSDRRGLTLLREPQRRERLVLLLPLRRRRERLVLLLRPSAASGAAGSPSSPSAASGAAGSPSSPSAASGAAASPSAASGSCLHGPCFSPFGDNRFSPLGVSHPAARGFGTGSPSFRRFGVYAPLATFGIGLVRPSRIPPAASGCTVCASPPSLSTSHCTDATNQSDHPVPLTGAGGQR